MRRVVVVGGGIGGLTAAVALHRRGWQVRVLEEAPHLEPVGAGISLWPNALRALDVIGVGEGVRSGATLSGPSGVRRPDGHWLARSDTGAAIQKRFGDPLVLVHRAELVGMLADRLPPDTVRTATAPPGARPGDGEVAELTCRFGEWHDPIPRIIAGLTPRIVLHHDIEELATPLPAYHGGRTALVGDAAHAMTPDIGQGGCMAIEDAVVLAALLDDHPVESALAEYTRGRLPRATSVATRSRRAGRLYQAPYAVQGVAARLMGLLPETAIARGLGPVVDWRPPS